MGTLSDAGAAVLLRGGAKYRRLPCNVSPRAPVAPRRAVSFVPPPISWQCESVVVVTGAVAPWAIEWASPEWLRLCGFRQSGLDVIGRTLRCIQGSLTSGPATARIMAAVCECRSNVSERLINYNTAREPFAHTVEIELLLDSRAWRATSREIELTPSDAVRLLAEDERERRVGHPDDTWSEVFEEYRLSWSERIAPSPAATRAKGEPEAKVDEETSPPVVD